MRHPSLVETSAPGQDSFLDITTNMVGILIILVMIPGMRVKSAPAKLSSSQATGVASAVLQNDQAVEQSLTADTLRTAGELYTVQQHLQAQLAERGGLATLVSARQQKIEARRQELDARGREEFDLDRGISEAQADLARLKQQHAQAEAARPEPIQIECYPTPLSKTVEGAEAHFQLRGGRIAAIPIDELVQKFKTDAQQKVYKLQDQPELTDTVGPLGGFRLRYTLKRFDIPPEVQLRTGRGGSFVRLIRWELIPVSSQLGETLEEALAEGSQFRQSVSAIRPGRTTITLWTYPDSFAEFRRLKKELYHLGFATAGRPLPDDILVGGSPEGSKSAAE